MERHTSPSANRQIGHLPRSFGHVAASNAYAGDIGEVLWLGEEAGYGRGHGSCDENVEGLLENLVHGGAEVVFGFRS